MNNIINWNILSSPANWLIIFLVLYLLGLLAHVLYEAAANGNTPLTLPQGL